MTESPQEPAVHAGPGRTHVVFFASMTVLALIVTVTAVTLHADNSHAVGRADRVHPIVESACDHVDVNLGLDWERCGHDLYCDAEDGYLTRAHECCRLSRDHDVMNMCCEVPGLRDPRGGLFDAEADFASSPPARC